MRPRPVVADRRSPPSPFSDHPNQGAPGRPFLLALANARQRSEEIGILRAIGLKSRQIIFVFLSKATMIGLAGAVFGVGLGIWLGWSLGGLSTGASEWQRLFSGGDLILTIVAAPVLAVLLSGIASWVPALLAAKQDPAIVLQGS